MNRGATILAAFALDLVAGDPAWLPHPVRAIGAAIAAAERVALRAARNDPRRELVAGSLLAAAIVGTAGASAAAMLAGARVVPGERQPRRASDVLGIVLAASTIATRDLLSEVDAVIDALSADDLARARLRLARIVGRDTHDLDAAEIARAVIETLAESACDGIVAPLCALAIGGVPMAFAFKAASTLDSMIGHIEPPYTYVGRFAAKADDVLCFVPARLTGVVICLCAPFAGGSRSAAWQVLISDGGKHRSPNAGRPEAAMAGALRVRLGGTNTYGGVVHAGEVLGHRFEPPGYEDVRRARDLVLWVATVSTFVIALVAAACDGGAR